jgi:hypothetical protein
MMRWLEEFELKHVELIRCITGLRTMEEAWEAIAEAGADDGYAAFARRQSSLYHDLHDDAADLFDLVAAPQLNQSEEDILQAIQVFHQDELRWLRELVEESREGSST